MKKIIISIIVISIISGCWNYKELYEYAIATEMAIDYVDGKYLVSFLISDGNKLEKESSDSQYQSVLFSGSGVTIYEAIKNTELILPKQLYTGHLNSLVISEDVAKRGLYDSIEYLLEDSQSKKDFYVVLAKDCMARDILGITSSITNDSSYDISNYFTFSSNLQGNIGAKTFNNIVYDLVNEGIDTTISSYVIENKDMNNLESVESNFIIKLDELGIFNGDKLVGWANKNQSSGINIINNDANEVNISIPCYDGYVGVSTFNLKTKRDISKNYIKINTTGDALIKEITCDIDLKDNKNIEKLNNKINDEIKNILNEGYMFARSKGSDVFGFGLDFYRNNLNEYKKNNWSDVYFTMEPEIKVNVKIKNSGNYYRYIERMANEN